MEKVLRAGAAALGLMVGASQDQRELVKQIERSIPQHVALDSLSLTPHQTVLRGHADDFGAIADLLENLEHIPGAQEPLLRRAEQSARGYEYAVIIPKVEPVPLKEPPDEISTGERPPAYVAFSVKEYLQALLVPPWSWNGPEPKARPGGPGAVQAVAARDEHPLDALKIEEITVEEVFVTSLGGVARVRARDRGYLLRVGDRVADGDVGGIEFLTPTVDFVRFRRRVATPGVPYRPVVWLLATRGQGSTEVEATRLGDDLLGNDGFPPWQWELAIEKAPLLFDEMSGFPDVSAVTRDVIRMEPSFGTLDFRVGPSESIVHASPRPRPRQQPPRSKDSAYDPGNRRDPFRNQSLWTGRRPEPSGPRPRGIPGTLIDEIEVEGLFMTPRGTVAEVRTLRREQLFLRTGDQLYDGDIEGIDFQQGVIFKQIVQDPTELKPFQEVVKRAGPWKVGAGGRRDPFQSLQPEGAPAPRPPSVLAKLRCADLTAGADAVEEVLAKADRRLARYEWERGLAGNLDSSTAGARRFLDDVAQTASTDLGLLLKPFLVRGHPYDPDPFESVDHPPLAEMLALVGDLQLIAGRLPAAAEWYRFAQRVWPGVEPLCGRWVDGRLVGAESFPAAWFGWDTGGYWEGKSRNYRLTGYQLVWDPASRRVLERKALEPSGSAIEKVTQNWRAVKGGQLLAQNFLPRFPEGASRRFEVRQEIDDRLPLDLPELEAALRAAALRDPTQPWHRFFLGQALWAARRRDEAEVEWRKLWQAAYRATPYGELLWMAAYHEFFEQREWADRAYARALEQRRRLDKPVESSYWHERWLSSASRWLAFALKDDPKRRYLWWQRQREISGVVEGDAFLAALWAADLERRGDRSHLREELAYLERARRTAFDRTTRSAWLDYSLYLIVAVGAMLLAQMVVLGSRLRRRVKVRHLLRSHGLALLLLPLALGLALFLAFHAVSHMGHVFALSRQLDSGTVDSPIAEPAPLIHKVEVLRSLDAGTQVVIALAALAAMFLLALPAALFLLWRRARDFAARWIPGAAQVRAGARLTGYALFGLFVFALVPLSWVSMTRVWGTIPAPGIVSANFFLNNIRFQYENGLSPTLRNGEQLGDGRAFRRVCAESFPRLLAVYSGAELFWGLVFGALATSVGVHLHESYRRRRRSTQLTTGA